MDPHGTPPEATRYRPSLAPAPGREAWAGWWVCEGCGERYPHTHGFYFCEGKTYCKPDCVAKGATAMLKREMSQREQDLYADIVNVRTTLIEQGVAKGFDHTQTALWALTSAFLDYLKGDGR